MKIASGDMIVLCDRKAVHDLLNTKGAIYSDRPRMHLIDAMGIEGNVFVSSLNDTWKEKRKVLSHNFSPAQLDQKHFRVQEAEATVLMNDFLTQPDQFRQHIRRYSASIIHTLVHGFRAKSYDDFWGHAVFDVTAKRSECQEPGAYPPVDQFPFLMWIPERFAKWKTLAKASKNKTLSTWSEARKRVDERRERGDKRNCLIDTLLDEQEKSVSKMPKQEFDKWLGEMVEGGADTSGSAIATLLLVLAKYPEIQKKAHDEIDKVCGTDRSPLWSDFDNLPYINSLIKEGLRWRPIAPTGGPHRLRENNTYNGMLMPKDSTVFVGVWALNHDEKAFNDPEKFIPERYEGYDKLASHYAGSADWEKRDHYTYGAGRRICPGMHLAERNMWRTIAKLLWAFSLHEVEPLDVEAYHGGLTREPAPFALKIEPRGDERVATIKRELLEAREMLQLYE